MYVARRGLPRAFEPRKLRLRRRNQRREPMMKLTRTNEHRANRGNTVSPRHGETGCGKARAATQGSDDGRSWRGDCFCIRGSLSAADFPQANRNRWAKGDGVTDSQTGAPVTRHTLFQAASTSKPVTALAALKLVERGVLHLNGDVNRELKSWKMPANQFTREHPVDLRSLLSHTAGTTVHGFGGYSVRERLPTLRQILDGVKPANSPPIRVDKVPGKGFRYSGGGTLIAQRLVMDVTKEPFPEVMRSLVLNPIGMASSTYEQPLPKHLRASAASGHDDKGHPIPGKWHIYPEMQAAGLWPTPADMARYIIEIQLANEGRSAKVLHREMINKMLTSQDGGPAGLGPFLTGTGARRRFSHNGPNAGFRCNFVGLLNRGDGAVFMTNSDLGDPLIEEVFKSIATVYGWPD